MLNGVDGDFVVGSSIVQPQAAGSGMYHLPSNQWKHKTNKNG